MNINISSGSIPEVRQIAKGKDQTERQAKTLKSVFERFKETMPDGSINAAVLNAIRRAEQASLNKRFQFAFDKNSGQVMVKVIDANTDTVIRVLPPRELLRRSSRITEDSGFLLDETV